MPKYKPESRRKIEQKVKDIDSKAKDRTKHMTNVVKDNKAVGNLFRHLLLGGTVEGMREVNSHLQQARKEVKREYGHKKKSLEDLMKKGGKLNSEVKERGKYSKLNHAELTKALRSIKETPAAKRRLDLGRQSAQEDTHRLQAIHKGLDRRLRRIRQSIQDQQLRFETEGFVLAGAVYGADTDSFRTYLSPQDIKKIKEVHKEDVAKRGPVEGGAFDEKEYE